MAFKEMRAKRKAGLAKRNKASFKANITHSDKMSDFSAGKRDMKVSSKVDGPESRADRELRRMTQGTTSSAGKNAAQSKRRYK